jgi:hypothetical protein
MRESNPRLDLGKVAYYHYTNPAKNEFTFIARRANPNKFAPASLPQFSRELGASRQIHRERQAQQPRRTPQNALSLINFHHASRFHHRRSPLPLGEAGGSLAVDIDTRKLLAVLVVDRYLPVTVLSAPVPPHAAGLAGTFRFRHSSSDGTSCQGLSQFHGGRASNKLGVNFRNMNYKIGATLYRHVRPIPWMKFSK